MQMCNAEIMKKIKLLEQDKLEVLDEERRTHEITYQTQEDKIDYGYSFSATREKIARIDTEIRKLKNLLNYSNATTIVKEFGITLGECLVYMAQLNNEMRVLEVMARKEATTRSTTFNGVIQYTTLNYSKAECAVKLKAVKEEIAKLQIAIDKTNLNNMIEIN